MATSSPPHGYRPLLDSLRALAVWMVMFHHFGPAGWALTEWGVLGVEVFFVLSGYLITGILLRSRGAPVGRTLLSFTGRRAVRILPVYFITLLFLALFSPSPMSMALANLTYTTNFGIWWNGGLWESDTVHFWSLAVEEQFYLIWPLVILLAPRRVLAPALVGLVAVGLGWRLVNDEVAGQFLLPGTLDLFALGAIACWARDTGSRAVEASFYGLGWVSAGLLVWAAWWHLPLAHPSIRLFVGLVATMAVSWAASVRVSALDLSPIRWIGRVSYGLYLLHLAVAPVVVSALGLPSWAVWPVSFGLAALSFYGIERPALRLKRFFPYPQHSPDPQEVVNRAGVPRA